MIPGDNIDSLLRDDRSGGPLNRGQTVGYLFEPPKATRWFCESQLSFAGCAQPRLINWFNLTTDLRDERRWVVID